MSENKTKQTTSSVTSFLNTVKDRQVREDCDALIDMMRQASNFEPAMWGSAIIGFGTYHYVYESGREGDTVIIGFSPRKQNIALYLSGGVKSIQAELAKLGKHKEGAGCLYINKLSDVNPAVLKKILAKAVKEGKRRASSHKP